MIRKTKTRHIILKLVNHIGVKTTAKALMLSPATINRWCRKSLGGIEFGMGEETSLRAEELLQRLTEVKKGRNRHREIPIFDDLDGDTVRPVEDFIYKDRETGLPFGVIDA